MHYNRLLTCCLLLFVENLQNGTVVVEIMHYHITVLEQVVDRLSDGNVLKHVTCGRIFNHNFIT